jgi:hypothetical protein
MENKKTQPQKNESWRQQKRSLWGGKYDYTLMGDFIDALKGIGKFLLWAILFLLFIGFVSSF